MGEASTWMALVTLAILEIVLGVDNIVMLAIMASRLPREQRKLAYRLGLVAALGSRLTLLSTLSFIMGLTKPLFTVGALEVSGRNVVLIVGGLFLMYKASREVFDAVETGGGAEDGEEGGRPKAGLWLTVFQIMLLDIVFSLDSVITAVGIGNQLWVMATAMVIAVGFMLMFAAAVGEFVNSHPSTKLLALSFLMLVGVLLVAEGFGQHVEKGYLYFAMGFSFGVELLNLRMRRRKKKVDQKVLAEVAPGSDSSPAERVGQEP